MTVILKMLYAFAIGVAGHQSSIMFNKWDERGRGVWVLLGRYAVGIVMVSFAALPFVPNRHREKAVLILFGVSTCVGAGVASGYIVDELLQAGDMIDFEIGI